MNLSRTLGVLTFACGLVGSAAAQFTILGATANVGGSGLGSYDHVSGGYSNASGYHQLYTTVYNTITSGDPWPNGGTYNVSYSHVNSGLLYSFKGNTVAYGIHVQYVGDISERNPPQSAVTFDRIVRYRHIAHTGEAGSTEWQEDGGIMWAESVFSRADPSDLIAYSYQTSPGVDERIGTYNYSPTSASIAWMSPTINGNVKTWTGVIPVQDFIESELTVYNSETWGVCMAGVNSSSEMRITHIDSTRIAPDF